MNLRNLIINLCDRYLDKYGPEIPPGPPQASRPAKKRTEAIVQPKTSYELWRAYKLDNGPRVTAPRGKGKEWGNRLYCEKRLRAAQYYTGQTYARKQLKAGCKRDQYDRRARGDKGQAWGQFIDICEGVINGYDDSLEGMYWEGAREIVDEAYGNAQYMLYLVRG